MSWEGIGCLVAMGFLTLEIVGFVIWNEVKKNKQLIEKKKNKDKQKDKFK